MKVLWGVRDRNPDWMEEIISEDEAHFDDAKRNATQNGFSRFRVATIDMTTPLSFTQAINSDLLFR